MRKLRAKGHSNDFRFFFHFDATPTAQLRCYIMSPKRHNRYAKRCQKQVPINIKHPFHPRIRMPPLLSYITVYYIPHDTHLYPQREQQGTLGRKIERFMMETSFLTRVHGNCIDNQTLVGKGSKGIPFSTSVVDT